MRRLAALCLLVLAAGAQGAVDAAALFAERGVEGTLVVRSLARGDLLVHGAARASEPRPAASTFKIPNTLIALETGVVGGPEHPFPWDGVARDLPQWNRDQTLASAFRVSCVWCYQRIAAEVGHARYREALAAFGYGALPEDFALTEFWLDGTLRISVLGQLSFLRRLQARRLPLSPETFAAAERVMRIDEGEGWRLYAKSGWFARTQPGTGWYVGWLETADDVLLFALAIDTRDGGDLPAREGIVRDALTGLGALPGG